MKTEKALKQELEKIELDFKHYQENFKGFRGNEYYNQIRFFENVIMTYKYILEIRE